MRHFKLKAVGTSYGYGYNLSLSAGLNEPPININKITHPVNAALLADAAQINTFQPPASPENPLLEEFYYINIREQTVHFRHNLRANVVYCDGHIEMEKPVPDSLDKRLPEQCVGFILAERIAIR